MKLPPIQKNWHKYERGFLVGFGGSKEFKGAIKLSGKAALRSGAGIVRLFSLEDLGDMPDELIFQTWEKEVWNEALLKAHAVMIGPGMGRSLQAKDWLESTLSHIQQPVVLDADALFFLPSLKKWPENVILTPHIGEMERLLGSKKDPILDAAKEFASNKKVVLLLKGNPTYVFSPQGDLVIIQEGDPAMATAGSGDVLTGIIGALLAQRMKPFDAAVLGAKLHAISGKNAADIKTSYSVIASDLIEFLPSAFKKML